MILSLPNPESAFARPGWTTFGFAGSGTHPFASALSAFESITALDSPAAEIVPEPDTLALLGGALAVFALVMLIRRKRRRK